MKTSQETRQEVTPPRHVAIIMDGNGRWGLAHGRLRVDGHRAGAQAVRRTIEAAAQAGIAVLTLYAFSSDNWKRPAAEVGLLMELFGDYLQSETSRCLREGVRLEIIGRRDRLSASLLEAIHRAERMTEHGSRLLVRIAIDYSARAAIVAAADTSARSFEEFSASLGRAIHARSAAGEVDLLIRTGREKRLSDFLLWESAYAELYFSDELWPDFNAESLGAALSEFHRRRRRFGAVDVEEEAVCSTS